MNNKRICLAALALMFSAAAALGQNLNPTVEVTNTYEGDPSHIQKPKIDMAVPDSLLHFDMDFGYEVFNNPYEGSYNFKPYMLNIKPGRDAYRGHTLYLKAGAGYSLHPQLDFVYSPDRKGPFQFSIYANHRSYFGKYHDFVPLLNGEEGMTPDVVNYSQDGTYELKSDGSYSGHDALTRAGFDGRYSWDSGAFTFGVGYYGLNTKDTVAKQSYNAGEFYLGLQSYNTEGKSFYYDAVFSGRIGSDKYDLDSSWPLIGLTAGDNKVSEGILSLRGNIGPQLWSNKFLIGFEGLYATYGKDVNDQYGIIAATPKWVYERGRWKVNVGVRLQKFLHDEGGTDKFRLVYALDSQDGGFIYPDAHVSFAIAEKFMAYADVTGGTKVRTLASSLEENHFLNPIYSAGLAMYCNDVENVNVKVGIKGSVKSVFNFDLNAGGINYDSRMMDGASYLGGRYFRPMTMFNSEDLSVIFVNALMGVRAGEVRIDAGFHYRHTKYDSVVHSGLADPDFSAHIRGICNITPRIWAGVQAKGATERKGQFVEYGTGGTLNYIYSMKVPGWIDVGLLGGYQYNRRLGFWIESGNLLCQKVQINPFYAEKGLWVTAGITLSL